MRIVTGKNPWFIVVRAVEAPRVRLFCLHHAGGGASTFRGWSSGLPDDVEVVAVQLPGRESRFIEPLIDDALDAADALTDALEPHLDVPFAFFGFSMGALLMFEVARSLEAVGLPAPRLLALAARQAPHRASTQPGIHHLPDAAFLEKLRDLNGVPAAALASAELMALLLPVLRNDFRLCDTYEGRAAPAIESPIVAMFGTGDHVPEDDVRAWRECTRGSFEAHAFEGDHFFIRTQQAEVLRVLGRALVTIPGRGVTTPIPALHPLPSQPLR